MKRKWNAALWGGLIIVLLGFFSFPFFIQFASTRDVPWVNFLLFAIGGVLLVIGLRRAFGQPQIYRGKVFGSIFALLGLAAFGFFSYVFFVIEKQLPASSETPAVGQKAPDFTLPDSDNKPVALADLISKPGANGQPAAALLIFYRGFW